MALTLSYAGNLHRLTTSCLRIEFSLVSVMYSANTVFDIKYSQGKVLDPVVLYSELEVVSVPHKNKEKT